MNEQNKKSKIEGAQQTIKFFEKLLRASADGILITDATHNIMVVNETFCNFFRRQRHEIIETNIFSLLELLYSEWPARWTAMVNRVHSETSCCNVEFKLITQMREMRCFSVNASVLEQVANEDAGVIISIWREVTEFKKTAEELKTLNRYLEQRVATRTAALITKNVELQSEIAARKQIEEKVEHVALHDTLTALPNRVLFGDRLCLALAQVRRTKKMAAVICLNLDKFKIVNETLGHNQGDLLLQGVAGRLKGCVREDDTIARLGGDEFAIVLSGLTHVNHVHTVANKILIAMKQPYIINEHELYVKTSMGISLYPNDGDSAEILLKNADIAMHHTREQGGNNYTFYVSAMYNKSFAAMILERDIHRALERKEFVVYYQPQVDTNTGLIIGMEALVRWQHPHRGLISPVEFLPFAEDSRMIISIDEMVLHTVCMQNKAWLDKGFSPLYAAVNLSAHTFQQNNLIELVTSVLKETGMPPHLLELEITEGAAMQNLEATIYNLTKLRELGIQIALDDFGTGFSSLFYLKKFPINKLKISQHFVRDLTTDQNDKMIVGAVIALAHSLKFGVIAEGVETNEQLDFLKQQHCTDIQGYLFHKPLSMAVFEELLSKNYPLHRLT
ncbi:MAG: EAL domain-containing protein [Planctomycetota bacterium]